MEGAVGIHQDSVKGVGRGGGGGGVRGGST